LGTAVPKHRVPQTTTAEFMSRALYGEENDSKHRVVHRMAERSGIRARHSVLGDYGELDPAAFSFFPRAWSLEPFPTTGQRLAVYEREAAPLAIGAARRALDEAGVAPSEVTHFVLTTCTGFFAPGPDHQLVQALGLPLDVKRTLIGFMGCYAGFNGIRAADDIVRAHPGAVVLQVAVELCTLHLQKDALTETLVSNLLFADGAAAAVYRDDARCEGVRRGRICGTASRITPDTDGEMSWRIGDHGFVMRLSPEVPRHLERNVLPFVDELGRAAGVERSDVRRYAVHPGGRRVLEATQGALEASDDALSASHEVLSDYGNMSSATILFVLDRALRGAEGMVAALGFGPGLTMEGAIFEP
jgi:predicted naringenin-chalcone synthase